MVVLFRRTSFGIICPLKKVATLLEVKQKSGKYESSQCVLVAVWELLASKAQLLIIYPILNERIDEF